MQCGQKCRSKKSTLAVVVMDGEPHEQPPVIGSSADAENFVRSVVIARLHAFDGN